MIFVVIESVPIVEEFKQSYNVARDKSRQSSSIEAKVESEIPTTIISTLETKDEKPVIAKITSGDRPPDDFLDLVVVTRMGISDFDEMKIHEFARRVSSVKNNKDCSWSDGGWLSDENEYNLDCESKQGMPARFNFTQVGNSVVAFLRITIDGEVASEKEALLIASILLKESNTRSGN